MKKMTMLLMLISTVILSGCMVYPHQYQSAYYTPSYQYQPAQSVYYNNQPQYYQNYQTQRQTYYQPQQQYYQRPQYNTPTYYQQQYARPQVNVGGALIGGAAGALIGSNIGKGNGKTAATAVGAVIGTIIGAGTP